MIKVCSPQLGLSETSTLGGEVHDFNLLKELTKKGVLIDVLLPKDRITFKSPNLRVSRLPFRSVFPPHLFNIYALPYILSDYSKNKFDILRVHSPYFLGLSALAFKKIAPKAKVVTTIHLKETRPDLQFILSKTISAYDHIFTVSDYLKEWIVKDYNVNPSKVSVIFNGVNPFLHPNKKDTRLINQFNLKGKITLLNIGLQDERKNILFLLEVYKELLKNFPNLALILCGKGPLKDDLVKYIHKNGWESQVFVLDPVFSKEKNKLFNLCDIFLFPSLNEGFGLVAAEAMACSKPVVASNNSSLPEVVDNGKTGFLVETNNLNDWVEKISILINDSKKRAKSGENGLAKQKKEFTWDKVSEKTLKVYKDTLKS